MFSRILIKLVDQAIIPAMVLLVSRLVSILFFARLFGIPVSIDSSGFVFTSHEDYVLVNSYSILAMTLVLALGLLYVLIKALKFHDTHVTPAFTTKLYTLKLSLLVQTSFDIYSQGVVWLSYNYLMLFISGVLLLVGLIYSWVFIAVLLLALLGSAIFAMDVEKEINIARKPFEDASQEEYVLTFDSKNE